MQKKEGQEFVDVYKRQAVQKRFFHAARQEVEENADQFLRGDGAAIGGKADFHVDDKTAVGQMCIRDRCGRQYVFRQENVRSHGKPENEPFQKSP